MKSTFLTLTYIEIVFFSHLLIMNLISQTTDSENSNSNINYHYLNTPYDYDNGYSMKNGDVFPVSYINTPAHNDTFGDVTISDLSQSYPIATSDSPHSPQTCFAIYTPAQKV
jgi:hypothetical protein